MSAEPLSPKHTAVLRRGVDVGLTVTPTAGKQTIHLFASDSAGCPAFEPWTLSTGSVLGCGVDVGSVHAIKLDWLAYRRLIRRKRKPGAVAGSNPAVTQARPRELERRGASRLGADCALMPGCCHLAHLPSDAPWL